jgi:fumarate reductase subunit C
MIRQWWDKLGEYLAVYVATTIAALVLRWFILKVRRARDGKREPDARKD